MTVAEVMERMGRAARAAARVLEASAPEQKNRALRAAAACLRARKGNLKAANERDMREAGERALSKAMLDRLETNNERVDATARGLGGIAGLAAPIGTVLAEWTGPNGMRIQRVRVPLGVIGIIYESRPNVTADAG